jgi:hypothetical protein
MSDTIHTDATVTDASQEELPDLNIRESMPWLAEARDEYRRETEGMTPEERAAYHARKRAGWEQSK